MARIIYEDAITADANFPGDSGASWYGKEGTVVVSGISNATVKLQTNTDNSTVSGEWEDVGNDVTFTSDGVGNFLLHSDRENPLRVRLNVSGASSETIRAALYSEDI